jgi:hypothetical protein
MNGQYVGGVGPISSKLFVAELGMQKRADGSFRAYARVRDGQNRLTLYASAETSKEALSGLGEILMERWPGEQNTIV